MLSFITTPLCDKFALVHLPPPIYLPAFLTNSMPVHSITDYAAAA